MRTVSFQLRRRSFLAALALPIATGISYWTIAAD
jgi:hypothetical protein